LGEEPWPLFLIGCSVAVYLLPIDGRNQGGQSALLSELANLLHCLVERRPFFFQTLILDLT
jgi:hypothetical protein